MNFLNQIVFSINGKDFYLGGFVLLIFGLGILFLLYKKVFSIWLIKYYSKKSIDEFNQKGITKILKSIFLLLGILLIIFSLELDIDIVVYRNFNLKLSTIFEIFTFLQFARLIDKAFSKVLLHDYYLTRDKVVSRPKPENKKSSEESGSRSLQYIVYLFFTMIFLQKTDLNFSLFSFLQGGEIMNFRINNILSILLVFFVARILIWMISQFILYKYFQQNKVDLGNQYAIKQLLKYFIYVVALGIAVESTGIQMTVIWGGAAALLVGVGLGLQQTFNDLISGIILLFERTVEVGDVLEVDGMVGFVKKIGIRTSLVETRDQITIIIPNSKLIVNKVKNWSHYDDKARFTIDINVAYGSDTKLVKELLLLSTSDIDELLKYPPPFVRFINFGESGLDFKLYFWSRNFIDIEQVKSDIRFEIDSLFRKHKISIPFPQRDIWIRNKD